MTSKCQRRRCRVPRLTPDKLDELRWIALATLTPVVRRIAKSTEPGAVFVIAIEARESGAVMRMTLAESENLPRMVLELPEVSDIELWPACSFCARRAVFKSTTTGELACDGCAHNRQEFEPISVV